MTGRPPRSTLFPYTTLFRYTATTEIYTLSLHDAFRSRWSPYPPLSTVRPVWACTFARHTHLPLPSKAYCGRDLDRLRSTETTSLLCRNRPGMARLGDK